MPWYYCWKFNAPSWRQEAIFWNLIGLSLASAFVFLGNAPMMGDEYFHIPQIVRMMHGDYHWAKEITVPPTYHIMVAWILNLTDRRTLRAIRFVSLLGSTIGVWFFYRLAEKLWPEHKFLRTAQFVFLPVLFPLAVSRESLK